jgi:hypothetical protein
MGKLQDGEYITMDFNEIGVSFLLRLMDSGHHHDDMPRAAQSTRSMVDTAIGMNRPHESLLLTVFNHQQDCQQRPSREW